MKTLFRCVVLLSTCLACSTGQEEAGSKKKSPIEGNWVLVENVVNGKLVIPTKSPQFKTFLDGYFNIFMYNPDGSFHGAGAGPYDIDGKKYRETFEFESNPTWIGYGDEQEWELKGDTLITKGFKKVFDPQGKVMPPETWGGDLFVEKRVRVKR